MKLILFSALVLLFTNTYGQNNKPPLNWQNLDLKRDGVFGVSMELVYQDLLKFKVAKPIIVAVIDGGIEIDHSDLKSSIFVNQNEISSNCVDDDHNGYVDDINGWNFLGSSEGSFYYDNVDLIRELREAIIGNNFARVTELNDIISSKKEALILGLKLIEKERVALSNIVNNINKIKPSLTDFIDYKYQTYDEADMLVRIVKALRLNNDFAIFNELFQIKYKQYVTNLDFLLNLNYDPRKNNKEFLTKFYGNNDVKFINPFHGTHVSGIIAADRFNNQGIKGVADKVLLLPLRAVPDGDFREKDVANAIYYAVQMHAKVINMSFIKSSTLHKATLDSAVKYAIANDVLIVHGAGNEGLEQTAYLSPSKRYLDGEEASSWIEVGASGWKNDNSIVAPFSNYGVKSVDVFAPGVQIISTWVGNTYRSESGTSMAAPVVTGVAAMLRAYYPNLSAIQIKNIILSSVVQSKFLKDKCISGGVINAYNAFRIAENYKNSDL